MASSFRWTGINAKRADLVNPLRVQTTNPRRRPLLRLAETYKERKFFSKCLPDSVNTDSG